MSWAVGGWSWEHQVCALLPIQLPQHPSNLPARATGALEVSSHLLPIRN